MKLSRKSEYACLALSCLAGVYDEGRLMTINEIALNNGIPKKYLEQILLQLKKEGIVRSVRGKDGGYALARKPGDIYIAEVLRLFDGALAPVESVSRYFYNSTPIEANPFLVDVFRDIRNYVADKLEKTSFEDIKSKDC